MTWYALALVFALDRPALTLGEAVRNARLYQPTLRQAHALSVAAQARACEARAPLLPQVLATATYERATGNRILRTGADPLQFAMLAPPTFDTYDVYRFELTATQLIYDFGQTSGQFSAALAAAGAQQDAERAQRIASVFAVRAAFFAALAQRQLVGVAQKTLDNAQHHLAQVEAFVRAKARPDIDLAQARLDVGNAQVQLIGAENAYDAARADLNQAMGAERDIDYDVSDAALAEVSGEGEPPEALVGRALATRPEIASLHHQAQSEEDLVHSALGGYGPTLSAGVGANDVGPGLDKLRWNLWGSATLSWPLFQGMIVSARVSEARANLSAIEAQADAFREQVRVEVEHARLSVRAAKAALDTATRALDNADERLALAQGRYEAGLGNALELGDAIVAQSLAAAQKVRAEYMVSVARAALLQALGREE